MHEAYQPASPALSSIHLMLARASAFTTLLQIDLQTLGNARLAGITALLKTDSRINDSAQASPEILVLLEAILERASTAEIYPRNDLLNELSQEKIFHHNLSGTTTN